VGKRKYDDFDKYTYKEQANSLKARINWIEQGVAAHVKKGKKEHKRAASAYPRKVIRHLHTLIRRLEKVATKS
jgi:hypothetical protein